MLYVDFYKEYVADLSKIKAVVSKEDDTIMTGIEFEKNVDIQGDEDVHNLDHKDEDEGFLIDCIGMQWYVFIDYADRDLIKEVET